VDTDVGRSGVDVVQLVMLQQLTLWFRDLEDAMQSPPPQGQEHDWEEAFALYRKAQKLIDMGNAFATSVGPSYPDSAAWMKADEMF
jgi:hypothetical protein